MTRHYKSLLTKYEALLTDTDKTVINQAIASVRYFTAGIMIMETSLLVTFVLEQFKDKIEKDDFQYAKIANSALLSIFQFSLFLSIYKYLKISSQEEAVKMRMSRGTVEQINTHQIKRFLG